MVFCSVVGCSNHSDSSRRKKKPANTNFFRIPRIVVDRCERSKTLSTNRRTLLLARINRADLDPQNPNLRVCGAHFDRDRNILILHEGSLWQMSGDDEELVSSVRANVSANTRPPTPRVQQPKLQTEARAQHQLFLKNNKAIADRRPQVTTRTEDEFELPENDTRKPLSLEQGDEKPNSQPNRHRSCCSHDHQRSVKTDQHRRSSGRNHKPDCNRSTTESMPPMNFHSDKTATSCNNYRHTNEYVTVKKDHHVRYRPKFRAPQRECYSSVEALTTPTWSYATAPISCIKNLIDH
ncbi:hypothetical protein HPB49_015231 [Dermacentor silvarum]|uniref:Uncharacterized protein n=1 Tax=Dermacentor silvarum TaxID=543639 RepID=A0ACB8CLP4_DERSI|nr:hypothetical protein HPB49_015231 [Dermacentor silvarum]